MGFRGMVMGWVRSLGWVVVRRWVRRAFPGVDRVSTQQLGDWVRSQSPSPTLIDARRAEEFAVSHLPGACHARTVEAVQQLGLSVDQPIVVYCSVGYRSARLVSQLQAANYRQVWNLEGSIFQWFNEGRPVVRAGQPVAEVHPYNAVWGLLVAPAAFEES